MADYEELVERLRICPDYNDGCKNCPHEHDLGCRSTTMREAADAIEESKQNIEQYKLYLQDAINDLRSAHEKEPKWISAEEPPDNDRNIFICHGSVDFKAPCIGHYDPGMKMFYEDKNWFASPIYDTMFWCEMPKLPLPEPPKEADT